MWNSLSPPQIWSSETGVPIMRCEGIVSCEESILCVNLSEDNKRLVASNSVGLVMVSSCRLLNYTLLEFFTNKRTYTCTLYIVHCTCKLGN